MRLRAGDRVRLVRSDASGLPVVSYGRVGGVLGPEGLAVVMLDGELGGDVVDLTALEPVGVDRLALTLPGVGMLAEPAERRHLAALWRAEAEAAGIPIASMETWGDGRQDETWQWSLGQVVADGQTWVVTAAVPVTDPDVVVVSAKRPNRWDF
jgi:hypothetical protein